MEEITFLSQEKLLIYVKDHLQNSFYAKKNSIVYAVQGKDGQRIITISGDNKIETENIVRCKTKGCEDFIVYKVNNQTHAIEKNCWVIPYDDFFNRYEKTEIKNFYKPKAVEQLFIKVDLNMSFLTSWGEKMIVLKGGYLNITSLTDIYGVSNKDFNDTYIM